MSMSSTSGSVGLGLPSKQSVLVSLKYNAVANFVGVSLAMRSM